MNIYTGRLEPTEMLGIVTQLSELKWKERLQFFFFVENLGVATEGSDGGHRGQEFKEMRVGQ